MKSGKIFLQFGPALLLALLWEMSARLGFLNPFVMPAPSVVLAAIGDLFWTGGLLKDIGASLHRVFFGFALAVVLGTAIGLAIGLSQRLNLVFSPVIHFLRPVPPMAWIPLTILWFGIGNGPSYFLTMIGAIFPIILNTHLGVRSISERYLRVARCFEASPRLLFVDVIWPASLPYILSGYRIGLGVAWMSLVGAEMVAATSGLGYMIHVSQDLVKIDRVIAGMVMIGSIGVTLDFFMRRLERHLSPWFEAAR